MGPIINDKDTEKGRKEGHFIITPLFLEWDENSYPNLGSRWWRIQTLNVFYLLLL